MKPVLFEVKVVLVLGTQWLPFWTMREGSQFPQLYCLLCRSPSEWETHKGWLDGLRVRDEQELDGHFTRPSNKPCPRAIVGNEAAMPSNRTWGKCTQRPWNTQPKRIRYRTGRAEPASIRICLCLWSNLSLAPTQKIEWSLTAGLVGKGPKPQAHIFQGEPRSTDL